MPGGVHEGRRRRLGASVGVASSISFAAARRLGRLLLSTLNTRERSERNAKSTPTAALEIRPGLTAWRMSSPFMMPRSTPHWHSVATQYFATSLLSTRSALTTADSPPLATSAIFVTTADLHGRRGPSCGAADTAVAVAAARGPRFSTCGRAPGLALIGENAVDGAMVAHTHATAITTPLFLVNAIVLFIVRLISKRPRRFVFPNRRANGLARCRFEQTLLAGPRG
mmetsp:Transcript_24801/g.66933  ORF Transcript_24801/g.66933 Transcript_24801/m.66933 type:complete len:226 (-) Transcript_24801:23-700(-)